MPNSFFPALESPERFHEQTLLARKRLAESPTLFEDYIGMLNKIRELEQLNAALSAKMTRPEAAPRVVVVRLLEQQPQHQQPEIRRRPERRRRRLRSKEGK